ncbi:MAG: DUF4956 domain-containing protein [Acidaminobacteraceae bacterium]
MNDILTFKDLLSNGFSGSSFAGGLTIFQILFCLFVTLFLSLIVFYMYRKTYSGVVFSYNYSVSLVLMSLITAMVILSISSNLVLSLGMVGALSIVRFRTAIKEPLDIIFMFWAIAIGLTTGARLYLLSLIGTLFFSVILIILMKFKNKNDYYLLVIRYDSEKRDEVLMELSQLEYKIKSKNVAHDVVELVLEIRVVGISTDFVNTLSELKGIHNVNLVAYNGDYSI